MAVVYLEREGQQFGPFSIEEAQRYILEGRFGAQDLGWIDGMQEWLLIPQIPQLQTGAQRPQGPLPYGAAPPTTPSPAYEPPAYAPYSAPSYPGPQSLGLPQNLGLAAAKDFSRSDYAGFWRRAAALMMDGIIVIVVCYFLMFVVALTFGFGLGASGIAGLDSNSATINAIAIATVVFPALLTICYFAFWNASTNMATPGKMAAGLVVVNVQAQRISIPQSFVREFVKLIGTWFFFLTFVTQPISARRQAIHDFVSATVVLRQRPDAGMPSAVVWLLNLCWVVGVLILSALVIAFQKH